MTRDEAKKILGEGATEEQVTNLLNSFHSAEKTKNDKFPMILFEIRTYFMYNRMAVTKKGGNWIE